MSDFTDFIDKEKKLILTFDSKHASEETTVSSFLLFQFNIIFD